MHRQPFSILAALARRSISCCMLVFVFVPHCARGQTLSSEARKHFTEARQAQDTGSFERAAQEYTETLRLAPSFAGAYSNLGLVRYVQGDFAASAVALGKALQLDPKLVGANLYLGIDFLKLSQADKALPYLKTAVRIDPKNKDAQSWLGTAFWESGQPFVALEQFRKTDHAFPNDPNILFVLGEAYRKIADREMQSLLRNASGTSLVHRVYGDIYLDQRAFDKAEGHYQAALQGDAQAPDLHYQLGEVALLRGQLDIADLEYTQQLRLTPSNAAATARLAEIALLNGQIVLALRRFHEALALSPLDTVSALHLPPSFATGGETFDDPVLARFRAALPAVEQAPDNAARNLAIALIAARSGDPDRLQTAWAAFQANIPRQPPAPGLLERSLQDFKRQDFETSEAEILSYLHAHPDDLAALYLAAKIHRMLSLGVLDKLLIAFPESPRSHQLLAQTYEQRDEEQKALAEYEKVEELAPTLPGVHYALGHLLTTLDDLNGASAQLKQELRLNPDHPEANAEMGMVLLTEDQAPAAIPFLTKAIALQPDLWTAHRQLGNAFFREKNYDAARRELSLALAEDPDGQAHYQLALVYRALGDSEAARREFASSKRIKADRTAQAKTDQTAGTEHEQ